MSLIKKRLLQYENKLLIMCHDRHNKRLTRRIEIEKNSLLIVKKKKNIT